LGREALHDADLSGQRVPSERGDGLPAPAADGPSGGNPSAAKALSVDGAGRRSVRRGCVLAGIGVSGGNTGEDCGGHFNGGGGLWRRAAAGAADTAAVCRVLRHGGMRAGTGFAGGGGDPHAAGNLLHGCEPAGAAAVRSGGLRSAGTGVPLCCPPRSAGAAAAGAGVYRRGGNGVDGLVGQRKRPAGAGDRTAGAGGCAGDFGWHPAGGGSEAADGSEAEGTGGTGGAFDGGGTGVTAPIAALSGGGNRGWFAADTADRLVGNRRKTVSPGAGSPVPHGTGDGIRRPLGRRNGKGRTVWEQS